MVPSHEGEHPVALYLLGGVLANLLFAGICLAAMLAAGGLSSLGGFAFLMGLVLNIYSVLINLLPLTPDGIPNDGMNLWTVVRSKEAKRAMLIMFRVSDDVMRGKRYGDYDEEEFAVSLSADRKNYLVAWLVMAQAERLCDRQRVDEAIAILKTLPLESLPKYYRNMVLTEFLYYYIVLRPDEVRARELYGRKELKPFLSLGLPSTARTLAACEFFLESNREEGWRLLKGTRAKAISSPNEGVVIAELERLDDLECRFREAENGVTNS
jgi:hypothetical protein